MNILFSFGAKGSSSTVGNSTHSGIVITIAACHRDASPVIKPFQAASSDPVARHSPEDQGTWLQRCFFLHRLGTPGRPRGPFHCRGCILFGFILPSCSRSRNLSTRKTWPLHQRRSIWRRLSRLATADGSSAKDTGLPQLYRKLRQEHR